MVLHYQLTYLSSRWLGGCEKQSQKVQVFSVELLNGFINILQSQKIERVIYLFSFNYIILFILYTMRFSNFFQKETYFKKSFDCCESCVHHYSEWNSTGISKWWKLSTILVCDYQQLWIVLNLKKMFY